MHRIEGTYYTTDSDGNKIFQDTEENKTLTTAAWFNAVQEELCNIIEGLGGTVSSESSDTTRNQLYSTLEDVGIAVPLIESIVSSGADTFTDPGYGFKKIISLDCSVAPGNLTPSGTFRDGYIVEMIPFGAFGTLTFVPLGTVTVTGQAVEYVYCAEDDTWYYIE
jgi:hypothetical protein